MKHIYRFIYRKIKLINLKRDYDEILKYLKEKNIKILNEKQFYNYWNKHKKIKEPIFILRHDVDRSIKNIKIIEEIEKKHGVKSTLHIRVKNKSYKLKNIKKIKWKNFDIALHIEFDNLNDAKNDKNALEKLTHRKIIGSSIHGGGNYHISKRKCLNILENLGIKYIVNFNYDFFPKKENNILLIPCKISDIDSLTKNKFIENIDMVIKKGGCSSINIHPEYL